MSTLATLTVKLVGDISAFTKSMGDAQDRVQNLGVGMMKAGGIATAGLTAPLLGTAAAAIRFGQDLDSAMANVASLGVASERVVELKTAVQEMAIETGKSTTDLAGGLYQVISAFGDTAESADILRINAIAAAAGLATTSEAIALTSAVTKGYGDTSATAVQQAADLAQLTVSLGQTTFPELAASIGRVVPIAASLGVAQEELFAVMATGAGVTGTTSEVATQLRGVLQSMMAPTGDMATLINKLGYESGAAMVADLGLVGAVQQVTAAAEATNTPLQKYIGSIEGQTLALALAGPQAETFRTKLDAMAGAAGASQTAFEAQTQGINANGFAMDQARAKMEVFMQRIYDGLAPALTQVLDRLEPMVDWLVQLASKFASLDPNMQLIIVGVAALAAGIGPLLVVLGMAVTALGALLSPIGLVVLAIAAVIAIVAALVLAWNKDWGGIRSATENVMGEIGKHVDDGMTKVKSFIESGLKVLREWWDDHGESVKTIVRLLYEAVGKLIDNLLGAAKTIVEGLLKGIVKFWEDHGETITKVASNTWELIKKIIKDTLEIIGKLVDAFASLLKGDWEQLGKDLKEVWDLAWGLIKAILTTAKENLIAIATDIRTTLVIRMNELKEQALGKINDLKAGLIQRFNEMKSTATGIVDGLKGSVLGILSSLASEAFGRGAALVNRLADGIRSAIGAVVSAASALAAAIRRWLPGSDAEVGPLSDLYASGRALAQTLAAGMLANSAAPAAAAQTMTEGIADVLDQLKINIVEVVAALADLARTFAGGTEGADLATAKAGLDAYVPVVEAFGKVLDVVVQAMSVELVADAEERLAALTGMVVRIIPAFVAAMVLVADQFTKEGWVESVKAFSEGAMAAIEPVTDGIDALVAINEGVEKLDGAWIDSRMGAFTRILGGLVGHMRTVGAYFTEQGWVEALKEFRDGAMAAIEPVVDGVDALIAINEGVEKLDGAWIDSRMGAFTRILGGLVGYMRTVGAYFTAEGWVESLKDFSAGSVAAIAPVENGVKALIAINEGVEKLDGDWIDSRMGAFTRILGGLVGYMRTTAAYFGEEGWLQSVQAFSAGATAATAPVEKGLEALIAINEGIGKLNGYDVNANMSAFAGIMGGFVGYIKAVAVQFSTEGLESVRAFGTAAKDAADGLLSASEVIVEKAVPASADFATASATIGLNIMAGMASLTEPWGFAPGIVAVMQAIQQAVTDAMYNIQAAWTGLSSSAYQFGQLWMSNLINGVRSRQTELYQLLAEINARFGAGGPWMETGGIGGHGGSSGSGDPSRNMTINIYNPSDRPSDDDILRTMRNLAVMGI